MQNDILAFLTGLSDAELVAQVKSLVARDRDTNAQLVARLAELGTRDVHLREGYGSLFVYCRDALGLSEWEAYNRIEVARAARRFPLILDMLTEGSVNLTVRLLAPHLTPANHREVLDCARGKRKPEVEEIVARLSPRPDVRPSMVSTPAPNPLQLPGPTPTLRLPTETVSVSPLPVRPAAVTALSPDRYKLQLTIDGETLEKLRLAKDMLGHAIPSGDDAAILDRALTALLAELARKKFADTPRPRRSPGAKPGAHRPLRRGQARGVGTGPRALRLRGNDRPSVQRTSVPGVPTHRPARARRRSDHRPDRVVLPASQRLRRTVVLREAQTCRR